MTNRAWDRLIVVVAVLVVWVACVLTVLLTDRSMARTVAALPRCSSSDQPTLYVVTDGIDESDCGTGGGNKRVLCVCDGSTWVGAEDRH